jgi:putative colanic acid biosynthesis acetyltransferase WcaF
MADAMEPRTDEARPIDAEPPRAIDTSPHGMSHRIGRVMWGIVWVTLFRTSPRPLHAWRNLLLRLFGANLHATSRVYPRAKVWAPWNLVMHEHACLADDVDCYAVERIEIGAYTTVSQYSYLCGATHDFEDVRHPLVPLPITIGRRAWIAADVFVAPGVTIGDGAVVGARSSVFGDLPAWTIATGSPAKPRRARGLSPADFGEDDPPPADATSDSPPADAAQKKDTP